MSYHCDTVPGCVTCGKPTDYVLAGVSICRRNTNCNPHTAIRALTAERDRALARVAELQNQNHAAYKDYTQLKKLHRAALDQIQDIRGTQGVEATELRAEVERLRADYRGMAAAYDEAVADKHALRAALRRYGVHVMPESGLACDVYDGTPCTCGLDAALGSSNGDGGEAQG